MVSFTVETAEEFMERLRIGICLPNIVRISEKLMGAKPMFRQKIMATTSATINSNKISFHLEDRFEYLLSTLSVIMSKHKKS